ncbi:hypothetical protein GCM10028793_01690 [Nocardiopsis oceani]
MMREALDGDDLDARSGDGHHQAAGNGETRTSGEPQPPSAPTHADSPRGLPTHAESGPAQGLGNQTPFATRLYDGVGRPARPRPFLRYV